MILLIELFANVKFFNFKTIIRACELLNEAKKKKKKKKKKMRKF